MNTLFEKDFIIEVNKLVGGNGIYEKPFDKNNYAGSAYVIQMYTIFEQCNEKTAYVLHLIDKRFPDEDFEDNPISFWIEVAKVIIKEEKDWIHALDNHYKEEVSQHECDHFHVHDLKTLKDLTGSYETVMDMVSEDDLRQEIKKWIKYHQDNMKKETNKNPERENDVIRWLMNFFNLNEEDLK